MTIAYIYKWTHILTSKWYIGVRTKNGCHPDDGYICSSKIVKPLIKKSPDEWLREILFTGNPEEMLKMEFKILTELDAKNDKNSFNLQNGDGNWTTTGISMPNEWKQKIANSNRGKKRTAESIENYKQANKKKARNSEIIKKLKKPKPPNHGINVSKALSGRRKTLEHRLKLSKSQKVLADKTRTGKSYKEIFGEEKSKQIRESMSKAQKGKPCNNPIVVCPHCNKNGPSGAMNRWHFENCKKK